MPRHPRLFAAAVSAITLVVAGSPIGPTLGAGAATPGPAAHVAVVVKPSSVPATTGGLPATFSVTASITDGAGTPVTSASPTVTPSGAAPAGPSCLPPRNNNDGTYTATCSAGTAPGKYSITVTAGSASGSGVLYQTDVPAAVTVSVSPASVPADGLEVATVRAVVTDKNGYPIAGDTVTLSNSPGPAFAFNPVSGKTADDGSFTSRFVPPASVGSYQISAKGTPANAGTTTFVITPAPAAVSLSLNPPSINPDGASTTTATASVTDAAGHPVTNATVMLTRSSSPTTKIPTTNNGDGTYRATLTAVTAPQTETITATTENSKSGSATLDETNQPGVGLQLTPSRIPADGRSTATLRVVFVNISGQPEAGHVVSLAISGDATVAPATVTTGADGSATASVTASRTPGHQTITATSGRFSSTIVLTLTAPVGSGYTLAASDGGIFTFGRARFWGSTGAMKLNQPIVGMAATPSGNGYWLVAADGGIFNFGDAPFRGSTGAMKLNQPIVGMAATPSGNGYWLVAADGGIFNFGDAPFRGSAGAIRLARPIVGIAATPSGNGYWLVASDGGIFNYGDAPFRGSAGAVPLARPIVGIGSTGTGFGYWLVASDGGIFNYGDALFLGSAGAVPLARPIVGMSPTADGGGYWLTASDGGIFNYGDATFLGSTGATHLNQPIVAMTGT